MPTIFSRKRRHAAGVFTALYRCIAIGLLLLPSVARSESVIPDAASLTLPAPGAHQLRICSENVLELTLISTKKPDPAGVDQWNFADSGGRTRLPPPTEFQVLVDGRTNAVAAVGFKRRVLYAPLRKRDLRIGNYLYLKLSSPVAPSQTVEVRNPRHKLWPDEMHFVAKADPLRWNPVIHVNQVGYLASG